MNGKYNSFHIGVRPREFGALLLELVEFLEKYEDKDPILDEVLADLRMAYMKYLAYQES